MAVLVHQLVQLTKTTAGVVGGDASNGRSPGPVYIAPPAHELGVGGGCFAGARLEGGEPPHGCELRAQVSVIALAQVLQRLASDEVAQRAFRTTACVTIIPGLDRIVAPRCAIGPPPLVARQVSRTRVSHSSTDVLDTPSVRAAASNSDPCRPASAAAIPIRRRYGLSPAPSALTVRHKGTHAT